jgi:hypothetical protein
MHEEKTIVLLNQETKNRAKFLIDRAPYEPAVEVVIRVHKAKRTIQQNNLYWKWIDVIAGEFGDTNLSTHLELKRQHLIPILRRQPDFEEMVIALHEVEQAGLKTQSALFKKRLLQELSTTKLTTKQMSEYMDEIQKWAGTMGIGLPPGDEERKER